MSVHYLEFVCRDVSKQCDVLKESHGLSFGPGVPDLGNARIAQGAGGIKIGVRAPLADQENPTVRSYLAVDDIALAVDAAERAGAVIAYPPTQQGETGTWAIYILDGLQVGLWQA